MSPSVCKLCDTLFWNAVGFGVWLAHEYGHGFDTDGITFDATGE